MIRKLPFRKLLGRLCLAALAAGPLAGTAQTLQLKAGGGLSSCFKDRQAVGAYKIGIGYEHEFDQRWTVSPFLSFYGMGFQLPDETVAKKDEAGNPLIDPETGVPLTGIKHTSTTANYVELALPFNYYLRTGESRYVVFSAGPFAAVGVAGKQTVKGDTDRQGAERFFTESKTFGMDGTHRFDAGLQASVAYQLSRRWVVGAEGNFSLTRFSVAGERMVSGLITLTYRFQTEDFQPQKRKNHYF